MKKGFVAKYRKSFSFMFFSQKVRMKWITSSKFTMPVCMLTVAGCCREKVTRRVAVGELCHFKIDCVADTIKTYPCREVP
jgi:hypothetical protein